MYNAHATDAVRCKCFSIFLVGLAVMWFSRLKPRSHRHIDFGGVHPHIEFGRRLKMKEPTTLKEFYQKAYKYLCLEDAYLEAGLTTDGQDSLNSVIQSNIAVKQDNGSAENVAVNVRNKRKNPNKAGGKKRDGTKRSMFVRYGNYT